MKNAISLAASLACLVLAGSCKIIEDTLSSGQPDPDRVVTVTVYEPFDDRDLPVEMEVSMFASEPLKMAVKHAQTRNWDEALAALDTALEREKPEPEAYLLKALILEHQGKWSQAMTFYREANVVESSRLAQAGVDRVEASLAMDTE